MLNLKSHWDSLRSSLWFVPSLLVAGAIILALVLIELDSSIEWHDLQKHWPRLFGAGADGSRGMLTAIASSMITVAGVAFSIPLLPWPWHRASTRRECCATLCATAPTRRYSAPF